MGISDYHVVLHTSETLATDAAKKLDTFKLDKLVRGSRSVLAFRVKTDGREAKLQMTLNNKQLLNETYVGPERSWHQVVPANTLQDDNNTLTLKRTAGLGEITVSDIVLFYQRRS